MHHGHHQGSRDAFPTHIANAKIQFLVTDKMVVKVTTDHFGGVKRADYITVVAQRDFITFGQHFHLDFPSDIQLTVNVFPLQIGLLQFGDIPGSTLDDESENQQTGQSQQQVSPPNFYQWFKYFIIVIDHSNSPRIQVSG